jgi:hypothetical protein
VIADAKLLNSEDRQPDVTDSEAQHLFVMTSTINQKSETIAYFSIRYSPSGDPHRLSGDPKLQRKAVDDA